jgi:hypothetical protein
LLLPVRCLLSSAVESAIQTHRDNRECECSERTKHWEIIAHRKATEWLAIPVNVLTLKDKPAPHIGAAVEELGLRRSD